MDSGITFPSNGFLGIGATFRADVNVVVQLMMALGLIVGAGLARQQRYKAHGICQTSVLVLNLFMIGLVMWPSFQQQVKPQLSRGVHRWYYAAAIIHAAFGITAELVGLYIVIVAGTNILPAKLRFGNWKRWMRAELALWMIVLLTGLGTYCAWYVRAFR